MSKDLISWTVFAKKERWQKFPLFYIRKACLTSSPLQAFSSIFLLLCITIESPIFTFRFLSAVSYFIVQHCYSFSTILLQIYQHDIGSCSHRARWSVIPNSLHLTNEQVFSVVYQPVTDIESNFKVNCIV